MMPIPDFTLYSLALYSKERLLYSSRGAGLLPLYEALVLHRGLSGLTLHDKVTGLASARLAAHFGVVKKIYSDVASLPAKDFLDVCGIRLIARHYAANILTKDQSAVCPGERIALAAGNPEDFLVRIETFLGVLKKPFSKT